MIERRSPTPRKGERLVGYRPVTGWPRDAAGHLQLVYQFAALIGADGEKPPLTSYEARARDAAVQAIADSAPLPPKRTRSAMKLEQGALL